MSDALEVLYSYAQDYMLRALLAEEPDYGDALFRTDQQEQKFRDMLDDGGVEQLESLLDGYNRLDFHRGKALFRAGFRLAVELAMA